MKKFIFSFFLLFASMQATADTITLTWDKYVDGTVSSYQSSNYEIQVVCRVNTGSNSQRARVPASQISATFDVTLAVGDVLGCAAKAYRKSDQQWGLPSDEVTYTKVLPRPSAPIGIKLQVTE